MLEVSRMQRAHELARSSKEFDATVSHRREREEGTSIAGHFDVTTDLGFHDPDLSRQPIGKLRQVSHDPHEPVPSAEILQGLRHSVERLVRIEGPETLIDEQALESLPAVLART